MNFRDRNTIKKIRHVLSYGSGPAKLKEAFTMNKKQLNRVKSLYRDGVSPQVCVSTIISMSGTDTEASIFIEKFYNETQIEHLIKYIEDLNFQIKELYKEMDKDEPLNGEESPHLENK